MQNRKNVFVTGLPGTGKSLLSKKILLTLLKRKIPVYYINIGDFATKLELVTEYDYLHDTYTIDYNAVLQKMLHSIKLFERKVHSKNYVVLIETHDFCLLRKIMREIGSGDIFIILPQNENDYKKFLLGKKWPLIKIRENLEYFSFKIFEKDECYIEFVREYNANIQCICNLEKALLKLNELIIKIK